MEHGVIKLKDPLLIVCEDKSSRKCVTTVTMPPGSSYQTYGLLIADIIRHVARAFNVGEDEVIDWVNKELRHPTTPIEGGSVH